MSDEAKIILCADVSEAGVVVPAPAKSLCVHHKSYPVPAALSGVRSIGFDEFESAARAHLQGVETLFVVGLNRAMTPSNRTAEVFEILFNATPGLAKVSIDRTLFVFEPWRAWFHFGLVGAPYLDYSYSYLAESDWKGWRDGFRTENPFDVETVERFGRGVIETQGGTAYIDALEIETIEQSDAVHTDYSRLKSQCFVEERTITPILRRLAAFAQGVCPTRTIPSRTQLFRRRRHSVVVTDLGIDRYLATELADLTQLTQAIHEAFHTCA